MTPFRPQSLLPTHEVTNQPEPLTDYNLFDSDLAFAETVKRLGDADTVRRVRAYGAALGRDEILAAGDLANRETPELVAFDRFGRRLDEVRFHPSYHRLMSLGMEHGQHSIAWTAEAHGHLSHCALEYLMHQVEAGVCCPLSMTYAGLPALKANPALYETWAPKLLSRTYDPAFRPVADKAGATMGMAMTEKQGGSDVRANATRATHVKGETYELVGHKWFCSAPMSDAFLTLAYTDAGLTCFFVPRWTAARERNRLFIQRLKDKLGNKANASSEIEYHGAEAIRVGAEGRGIQTIIQMVHHTRVDTTVGAASLMRAALVQALHFTAQRSAFQKRLIDQPLMQAVLADLALETEAAMLLAFRIAQAFDAAAAGNAQEKAFSRIGVAIAKYWLNKRVVGVVHEAMEAHGGSGFVEDGPMARLYREAPLNGIWEGAGNVICLDVLRALDKDAEAKDALVEQLKAACGHDRRLDAQVDRVIALASNRAALEVNARRLVEETALVLQADLMMRHAPAALADAFLASRLDEANWGHAFGTLPPGLDLRAIVERAQPVL
ncbi:DNA alkylation response protein [Rhodothalassium salexigens]|uniref:acyl-CoA dehydrogenase family protein n=1 Tax=Rhodothalassium salexigens TaxID=1086 RepID=UPI00191453AD|nr:acyl-CoA dehydrogenase family protein [Rhodothalassium salexigens]MBK5921378.1 DNA alkylation response protein [Rhodothalassium salexigens]